MARHALGLPNSKHTSYRNHYCLGPGSKGHAEWEALVAEGLAVKQVGDLWGGNDMFHLTLKGALTVRGKGEHISREDAASMRQFETSPR
jgi:aminopeptidase N